MSLERVPDGRLGGRDRLDVVTGEEPDIVDPTENSNNNGFLFPRKTHTIPASLADLVPRELDSIPETGMAGFPSFEYRDTQTETGESERLFASYELRVNLYELLQFDCLVDWPEGNYPDWMYGGGVDRSGAWAYVHE